MNLAAACEPGLGFGVHGALRHYPKDHLVVILRGKNKGHRARVCHEVVPANCSHERRFYLWLESRQNFWASNHILMNESGFKSYYEGNL